MVPGSHVDDIMIIRESSRYQWVVRWRYCVDVENHGYYTGDIDDAAEAARAMRESGVTCCEKMWRSGRKARV